MKNQLKLGVVLTYITLAIQMIVQLVYTPVMINLIGQSEYGLYTLVGSVVSYLSLLSFGATGAYLRFYMRYRKKDDSEGVAHLNGLFLVVFIIMSIVALIAGFILAGFSPQVFGDKLTAEEQDKAAILMYVLVFNIALTFPSSLFESIVSAHEQFVFQRTLNMLSVLFNPLICLPLLLTGFDSVAIVVVTLVISVLKLIVNVLYCVTRLNVGFRFGRFDFRLLKEIVVFSFFLFLNMLIDQINWSVDKYILGRVSGTNEVAVYGVSATINSAFLCFSTAISSVFSPKVNAIVAENKSNMLERLDDLFIKVGRLQFMVLGLIASGFVVFGRYFVTNIYVTAEYENSYYSALFLILPSVIPLIQNVGIEIQRAVNKHKFRAVIYLVMAVVNVIISIPLGIRFGSVGAAIGTCFSLVAANGVLMNIYYSKALGINITAFWKNMANVFRGMIIPLFFGVFIMNCIRFEGIKEFLLWALAYAVVYCFSVFLFGTEKYERDMVLKIFKKRNNL